MSVTNYFDELSSIDSSSHCERRNSDDDRISEQETVIKSLTYAVQVSEVRCLWRRQDSY